MEELIISIILGVAVIFLFLDLFFKTTKALLKLISALLLALVISISVLIFKIEKISTDVPYKNNHSTYEVNNHKGEEN